MGGRSLSLLSLREGSWASGVVDSTDVGQERICLGSGDGGRVNMVVLVAFYWSHGVYCAWEARLMDV